MHLRHDLRHRRSIIGRPHLPSPIYYSAKSLPRARLLALAGCASQLACLIGDGVAVGQLSWVVACGARAVGICAQQSMPLRSKQLELRFPP